MVHPFSLCCVPFVGLMGTAADEKSLNLFTASKSFCSITEGYGRKNGLIQSLEPNANFRVLLNCLEFDE